MTAQVQSIAKPETKELVAQEVLRYIGLNTQIFSGATNPSSVYQLMVRNAPGMYPYYREIEAKDTAISSSMDMRRLLVLARDESVAPSDEKNLRSKKYADGLDAFLKSIPRFNFAKWELLDAPAYGLGVAEIMWNTDGSRVWVDKIIGRPQELFRFNKLYWPQTGDLLLAPTVGGEGMPVPQNKFLVASYRPRHGDRRGLPILRDLFWASWFKRNALRLHLKFLEKGNGTVVVQYPSGSEKPEQDKAYASAMAIADELAVAVPGSFAVMKELLTSTRQRDAQDFRSMVDYWDAEMTRRILGQTLTTHGNEGAKGSNALGAIHEEMMYEIIRNDCQDVEDVINEQLCAPWLLWTFGPEALTEALRPRYVIEKNPPRDAEAELNLIQTARNMVPIKKSDIYRAAQIEPPAGDDDVIEPAATPVTAYQPSQL